jgi:crotonobetainyl-CoA:carnitine CoA-transferase CaiB-like acyl-CoA transferase
MLPGPIATQILADLGAEVIRIESPQGDITRFTPPHISGQDRSEWSSLFLSVNRSKKGVLLNLQKEGHRQILVDLVKRADVFVEGFRPGVLAKFGFDYQSTSTMNQKIVYCSISGFGQTGPNKSKPAHDINYFGLAGWLSETDLVKDVNFPPVRLPLTPVADLTAGLFAVIGILAALYAQKATGKGTYVDTSIFESALFCISGFSSLLPLLNGLSPHAAEAFAGNPLSGNFPFFTLYLTKDRKWLSVGALEPVFWETLCKILNLSDLALRQYPESLEEAKAVYYRLQEVFLSKDRAEWLERFEGENTCVFPVHSLLDLRTDPQIIHRKMLYSVPHPGGGTFLAPRTPLLFSEWDQATPSPPPDTTTDAQAILQGLGYSDDMIKRYFDSL